MATHWRVELVEFVRDYDERVVEGEEVVYRMFDGTEIRRKLRCREVTLAGKRCQSAMIEKKDTCWSHSQEYRDPVRIEKVRVAAKARFNALPETEKEVIRERGRVGWRKMLEKQRLKREEATGS